MDADDIRTRFPGEYDDPTKETVENLKDDKNFQAMLAGRGWTVDEDAPLLG